VIRPAEPVRRKISECITLMPADSTATLDPGFITLKVYDLLVPGEERDFSKSLFDAVAYSSLNFAALLWLIGFVRAGGLQPWLWYAAMFVLLTGMPAAWPVLFLKIRKQPWVARRVPSPNARVWDDIFARRTPYWVIVHLKDQRRIGGLYGADRSHPTALPRRKSTSKKSGSWVKTVALQILASIQRREF
jgi:hypothetical protein